MAAALSDTSGQDRELAAVVQRERGRLLAYIRRRIDDAVEAEDILQDALYELVAAYAQAEPVQHVGAWLTRVARNRIIDRFRRKRPELLADQPAPAAAEGAGGALEDLLPAPDGSPETAAMRTLLFEELESALAGLPREQREVFIAQELDGLTFRELSEKWGVSVNTLLSRKRYAVLRLRERLQGVYDDWFAG
ncbi:MAG: RNA polymerase sigma factor [Steroidobacteraceae bacterium]